MHARSNKTSAQKDDGVTNDERKLRIILAQASLVHHHPHWQWPYHVKKQA
jgi:hypothetical protein